MDTRSFPFPNITADQDDEAMILRSAMPMQTLSSSVVGGGYAWTRIIVNRHVDITYDHPNPAFDLMNFVRKRGIFEPFVGMMTAVYMHHMRVITLKQNGILLTLVLTAGYGNATSAGLSPSVKLRPGTINLIILIDANLSSAAMINAIITTTEAKTHVLRQQDVRTPDGLPATGTSTDAVVIACTGRGRTLSYAGPATPVGYLIGRAVRQGLEEAAR
jgi:iron complex transport system ATP-binding protein